MTCKLLLVVAALCVACGSEDEATSADAVLGDPTGDAGSIRNDGGLSDASGLATDGSVSNNGGTGCGMMDLLFVIDNSGSMSEEQTNLAANFPRVISVLDALKGGGVNYRVGVTTTAIGEQLALLSFLSSPSENGALLRTADMEHPWLERGEPMLSERFTRLATVGTNGSGQEQPLRAAKAALTDRVADGSNAGFLRPNALLAIVVLTDEDDSSSNTQPLFGIIPLPGSEIPVAEYVSSFDTATAGRGNWAAAVIAGDQMGGCRSAFGSAVYAKRLVDFVKQTGPNALLGSICQGDLAAELDKALNVFATACESFVPLF